jgi:hypothetical protein
LLFEHAIAQEHSIWSLSLSKMTLLHSCIIAFKKIPIPVQNKAKICLDYWKAISMCQQIFYTRKKIVKHTKVFLCSSIHFLSNTKKTIPKLNLIRLVFFSKPLIHFSKTIKLIQNFYHLELELLILKMVRQFLATILEIRSHWLSLDNFLCVLYLELYHLKVEPKMLFYYELILDDLKSQF